MQEGIEISFRQYTDDDLVRLVLVKDLRTRKFQITKVLTALQFSTEQYVVALIARARNEINSMHKAMDNYTNCHGCGHQLDFDCECRNKECSFYIPKDEPEREETKWKCVFCQTDGCPLGKCLLGHLK